LVFFGEAVVILGHAAFVFLVVVVVQGFGFWVLGCVLVFALASALCLRASCVAPVRGGTYFSLPPQRKVGKRKRLTPPVLVIA
jgi:hypothetical protein